MFASDIAGIFTSYARAATELARLQLEGAAREIIEGRRTACAPRGGLVDRLRPGHRRVPTLAGGCRPLDNLMTSWLTINLFGPPPKRSALRILAVDSSLLGEISYRLTER